MLLRLYFKAMILYGFAMFPHYLDKVLQHPTIGNAVYLAMVLVVTVVNVLAHDHLFSNYLKHHTTHGNTNRKGGSIEPSRNH